MAGAGGRASDLPRRGCRAVVGGSTESCGEGPFARLAKEAALTDARTSGTKPARRAICPAPWAGDNCFTRITGKARTARTVSSGRVADAMP